VPNGPVLFDVSTQDQANVSLSPSEILGDSVR
jgi:hypothetical protein